VNNRDYLQHQTKNTFIPNEIIFNSELPAMVLISLIRLYALAMNGLLASTSFHALTELRDEAQTASISSRLNSKPGACGRGGEELSESTEHTSYFPEHILGYISYPSEDD
jgi:hypothetical protein